MKFSKWVLGVLCLTLCLGLAASIASAEKVRVGYLHTLAVDGQFWIAMEKGYFKEEGLEMEPTQFTSGVPLMQALRGWSVSVTS